MLLCCFVVVGPAAVMLRSGRAKLLLPRWQDDADDVLGSVETALWNPYLADALHGVNAIMTQGEDIAFHPEGNLVGAVIAHILLHRFLHVALSLIPIQTRDS
jgi:hypothetical protein